jgi:hypothetical protein
MNVALDLDEYSDYNYPDKDYIKYWQQSRRNVWCPACGEHVHFHVFDGMSTIYCHYCKCPMSPNRPEIPEEDWKYLHKNHIDGVVAAKLKKDNHCEQPNKQQVEEMKRRGL